MQRVLVLDKNKKPVMPCHPARARELLNKGKAAVFRRYPFKHSHCIVLHHSDGYTYTKGKLALTPLKVGVSAQGI